MLGPFIHRYHSKVNTTVLHGLQMAECMDAEECDTADGFFSYRRINLCIVQESAVLSTTSSSLIFSLNVIFSFSTETLLLQGQQSQLAKANGQFVSSYLTQALLSDQWIIPSILKHILFTLGTRHTLSFSPNSLLTSWSSVQVHLFCSISKIKYLRTQYSNFFVYTILIISHRLMIFQ